MFKKFFLHNLVIILVSLLLITWFSSKSLKHFCQEQTFADLKSRAYILENQFFPYFSPLDTGQIDQLCKKIAQKALMRITVILPGGKVIGDSEESPSVMDDHSNRPEIQTALTGQPGFSTRFSDTLGKNMLYVAIPVFVNNETAGVIRTSMPLVSLENSLWNVHFKIIIAGITILLIAAILNYKISRSITRPLEQLEKGAKSFAQGDFKTKLPFFRTKEIRHLAETMNEMASQLDARMQEIISRNKEQEIILSIMKEGILVVDTAGNIIKSNRAGDEIIQSSDFFNHFIEEAGVNNNAMEETVVIRGEREEHFIQVYSNPINSENGKRTGTLIVLNDITHLKKLENIRRDFVANVSHELRTPITTITGFVETLLDGAINNEEEAEYYLRIIKKHSERLNAIIEDLLSISRLEQDSEGIVLERTYIKNILESAVQSCKIKADPQNIRIKLVCSDDIMANVNPSLIEQAVLNLVDNAINYSDNGSTVFVEAIQAPQDVVIKVADHGCGIPEEHLPRIFERFYRADKARSKKMGGTGLGLSIVKHIAQVHRGYVDVTSTVGAGSTFYIHLPKV